MDPHGNTTRPEWITTTHFGGTTYLGTATSPDTETFFFPYGQSCRTQQAFIRLYPNGLPRSYHMAPSTDADGVPRTVIEDCIRPDFFSTPRLMNSPPIFGGLGRTTAIPLYPPPYVRQVELWSCDKIQKVCNSLRLQCYPLTLDIPDCVEIEQLYCFFSGPQLCRYGVWNLRNVVRRLFSENQIMKKDPKTAWRVSFNIFIHWWLSDPSKRARLIHWDKRGSPIFKVVDKNSRRGIGPLEQWQKNDVTHALHARRRSLLNPGQRPTRPKSLSSAWEEQDVHNWLANEEILPASGLPAEDTPSSPATVPVYVNDARPSTVPQYQQPMTPASRRHPSWPISPQGSSSHPQPASYGTDNMTPTHQPGGSPAVSTDSQQAVEAIVESMALLLSGGNQPSGQRPNGSAPPITVAELEATANGSAVPAQDSSSGEEPAPSSTRTLNDEDILDAEETPVPQTKPNSEAVPSPGTSSKHETMSNLEATAGPRTTSRTETMSNP